MRVTFQPAEDVLPRAREVLRREQARLGPVSAASHLVLTGGSSLPGALTGGDIDLHLRVPPDDFTRVVGELGAVYDIVHPEIWAPTLATFAVRDDDAVGIAVTPIGSEHDLRFRRAWVRLATDPEALEAYNALKRSHEHGDVEDYFAAKSLFFDAISGERRTE